MNPLLDSWSPSVVFTPTTSHKRQLQAKDWNYVDQWLARHYGSKPVPVFERTPETLKYLLQLATLNEQEDEQRRLEKAVKEKALLEMKSEAERIQSGPLSTIESLLPADSARNLQSLALLSVALGTSSPTPASTSTSLVSLSKAEFELERQALSFDILTRKLDREAASLQQALEKLKTDPLYKAEPSMQAKTAEWERTITHFSNKAREYDGRIAAMEAAWEKSGSSRVLIPDIVAEEKSILELKEQVLDLEARSKGYQGLPPEKDLARLELERAMAEMEELVQKREELYERMAR